MTHPNPDEGFFQWAIGVLVLAGGGVVGWIHTKIDKKVSKEVFEEYRKAETAAHKVTHDGLKEIKNTQVDIYRKLDTKADKQ